MEQIKKYISEKRPSLSQSSLTTYASILKNLYKRVFGDGTADLDKFDSHVDETLHFLKDTPPNRRKTILSALVIITDKKPYRDLMLEDVRDYNKEIERQEKTPQQQASWIDGNEIKQVYDELKKNAALLYKKKQHTAHDLQQIQSYIIIALLGGVFIPPRRAKDFVDFVIRDVDTSKDNYILKRRLVFNSYKTAKTYGQQSVDIPVQLANILKKWISINPTKYLLFDSKMDKLSSVKLNQRLNKIFGGRQISINALRHSFLTDKYAQHSKEQKQLATDMSAMGSSPAMADTYIKLN